MILYTEKDFFFARVCVGVLKIKSLTKGFESTEPLSHENPYTIYTYFNFFLSYTYVIIFVYQDSYVKLSLAHRLIAAAGFCDPLHTHTIYLSNIDMSPSNVSSSSIR